MSALAHSWLGLALFASAVAAAEPAPDAILRWQNGETLTGKIVEASASELSWKSPLFAEPLRLGWHAVRRIDYPLPDETKVAQRLTADVQWVRRIDHTLPDEGPPGPFSIALRDGSHIYGDVTAITEEAVTIESARHSTVQLTRADVLSARRVNGRSLFQGPTGMSGWKVPPLENGRGQRQRNMSLDKQLPNFITGPGGTLSLPYWKGVTACDLELPDKMDVEFRVHATARPSFEFTIGSGEKNRLRIETWGDELVLVAGNEFKSLMPFPEEEREAALRICWDVPARKCSVYTAGGEWLADWDVPEVAEAKTRWKGVVLESKGRDLSLEFLRVRTWDGQPPAKFDVRQPRIELSDGRIIAGRIGSASAEKFELSDGAQIPNPPPTLAEVDSIIFSTDRPIANEQPAALTFADGTRLGGKILSCKEGRASLTVAFSTEPLQTALQGMRQLSIKVPAPTGTPLDRPLKAMDSLVHAGGTLHGSLVCDDSPSPKWQAVGAAEPASLSKDTTFEITRAFPPDAKFGKSPALFHVSSGEALPGTLRGLDATGVEITSPILQVTRLANDDLNAVHLQSLTPMNLNGFTAPGWAIVKGDDTTVKREGEVLKMEPGTLLAHPTAMLSSEIAFSVNNTGFSGVRLRMFCDHTEASSSTNLLIVHQGNQMTVGIEGVEGQFADQAQVRASTKPVVIRIEVQEKELNLFINDVHSASYPIDAAKRSGVGLTIEPASVWGNSVRPIALTNFSSRSAPGRAWLPEVNSDARQQALTIPRFRKADPPRHALIASNGDLLRGSIEAVTATHFGFRSGLESLQIPMDRVKAAIWLKKPIEGAPPSIGVAALQEELEQKLPMNMTYGDAGLSTYIDILGAASPNLKFKLPDEAKDLRRGMRFRGQTIGKALDQICALFGLRHRQGEDGEIIIEMGTSSATNLVVKTYRLKLDAFPSSGSPVETLKAAGIIFPENSTADWDAAQTQLLVTNTPENHARLAELLDSKFGGRLTSPTHWLQLTSGGRVGIAVEKFGAEQVTGDHPLYGRCTIPFSDISGIRSSPPEVTMAAKLLADWRTVFAQDPVLPEAGGANSPTIGKEAKAFKLPLLGGGDFDLGSAKGRVVVLDFWATWCGPCIKALPGLIEAMAEFPEDRVKLLGVNQSEPPEQVQRFLEARSWKLAVALDAGQSIAREYGVEGIPHTVIVGPDGKIAWVKTGYSPEADEEAAEVVRTLLAEKKGE